jgi:Uma2 family endonuclease
MDTATLLTTEDLLAMPDDGIERELSRGRLKEFDMTRRGPKHTRVGANITYLLVDWLKQQPAPRGQILSGDAGFQLRHDPDTTVGIDVAYISAELAKTITDKTYLIDGIPTLAVEILSPSDKQEDTLEKIRDYLDAGVPVVWYVETVYKTITVYRPDAEPRMFTISDELTAEPQLPGFRARMAQVFE